MASILKVDTIQDQDGNNIISENANVITIGASGDTITVPAGATVSGFTSAGIDDNATSTAITIDSSENVGIGTASPSRLLHLNTTSSGNNTYLQLTSDATGTGTLDGFQIIVAGNDASTILAQRENSSLQFRTNNTERMRINGSGNIGISTTSPNTNLDVVGTGVNGIELGQQSDNSANSSRLFFNNSTNIWTTYSTQGNFKIASGASIGNTSGTDRLVIDSSGNVGIGTSSPSNLLHIKNSSPTIRLEDSDGSSSIYGQIFTNAAGDVNLSADVGNAGSSTKMKFSIDGSERMRIDSSGRVGINESSPSSLLELRQSVDGLTSSGLQIRNTANTSSIFIYQNGSHTVYDSGSAGDQYFITGSSQRMRINSSGDVLIGTTSFSSGSKGKQFENNANAIALRSGSATTATTFHNEFHNPNGAVGSIRTAGTSTSYVTSSDYRLKENVSYDFDATTRLKQLKPARFNFIADANTTLDGFLAHEVQDIVPEAISGEKDAVNEDGSINPQGIDQSKLVPLLVKTIQELEARITALETNQP